MSKFFIITVDTEGDNLWAYKGGKIGTKNALFLPRFQELCEKYGFKPVYLTNYEMIMSEHYVRFVKNSLAECNCEVGVHLHAWNNPPIAEIPKIYDQNPYLIEYSPEVRRQKFKVLFDAIQEKLDYTPVSHRAGRWAMDDDYFHLLEEFGIKVDCSVTPSVSWARYPGQSVSGGSDYSLSKSNAHKIYNVLEVPMTIRKLHYLLDGSLKHRLKTLFKGSNLWLRPAMSSLKEMKYLLDVVSQECQSDYIEFMLHSSEVMPGGSPYFEDEASIEKLYKTMDEIFEYAYQKGYRGITLRDYANIHKL